MRPIRQTGLLLGIGLLLIVLVVSATLAYRAAVELHEAAADLNYTHEVIVALDALNAAALDAETGQRGYLITGEERYLKPYEDATKVIDQRIARIDELTKDDPLVHDQIPKLRQLVAAKTSELARTIALRKRQGGFDEARQQVLTDEGKKSMDAIREIVAGMQGHERSLGADRRRASDDSYTAARRNVVFAAVLGFVAVGAFIGLLYRYVTAQTQVTAEINTQRELLHTTLASIGDGVITTDHGCQVSFPNSVAENLTGWNLAESKGKHLEEIFRIVNEKTRQSVENPCTKVFREGIVVGLANHTVLIAKDGGERPIDDSAAPIRDDQGRLYGAVLVFRDATEQRAAAEARERLAAIVESSNDAIIAENTSGVITSWNKAAEQLFGYTAEEAIGKSIRFIVPPELREQVAEKMEKLRQGAKADFIDTIRLRKGGQRIEVSSHISPIRNKEGEVIGAAKVAHDISDRKRTERTLRFLADTSAELATLVDYQSTMQRIARLAVPFFADWCIVDMIDAKGRIERVAHAHADRAKEPLLKEYVERYPLDWNSSALSVRALRSGKPELISEAPAAFLDKLAADARHRELLDQLDPRSALSVPIQIRGTAVGTLNFVTSDSGRRYSAADVELATELAGRSAVAIENAHLYRDLKEAHRQKDDFLAMLAHELRNPISAIQYANEIARIAGPSEFQASDVIDRQVQHLVHLIDDLLDVSRITRGKIELRREHVDAATILQRAAATAEPVVKSRKHTLVVEAPSGPLPLFVDPTRAEQILVNLLINAAKYTPEGGQITAAAFAADGFAEFKIKDTGLGIPEPMLHRVFELFTQVNPSLDRSHGGLGIGLTVVRKLAELHGGSVSATSEGPGRGSEFTVRLPLVEAAPETDKPRKVVAASGAPQKMLVVDDNVDTARSLAQLLERQGHKIETAHDGYAAVEMAKSFRPDVVLLDLGLPGLDGYKVAERIRSDADFQQTRLIALSGYGQPQDRKRSKEVGFDQHLVKPVDFETLLAAIAGAEAEE
jgi:PAS domain S-box-containing protein